MQTEGQVKDPVLQSILDCLLKCCAQISTVIENTPVKKLQTANKFGDTQLQLDVVCDEMIEKFCRENGKVAGIINEQRPQYLELSTGPYVVTYDPLDGSSIVDTNFSIGTIFSIWKSQPNKLIGCKMRDVLVNSILVVYGPRTTCVLYNDIVDAVQELTLIKGKWVTTEKACKIVQTTKIFSPGNLRATTENALYREAIMKLMDRGLTLRYTGGLVPDAFQIFIKGNGLFLNVGSKSHKVKLRVLYEISATCFLVEKAGGKSISRGMKDSALDYVIKSYDDKLEFAVGSAKDVESLAHLFE